MLLSRAYRLSRALFFHEPVAQNSDHRVRGQTLAKTDLSGLFFNSAADLSYNRDGFIAVLIPY